MIIGWNFYSRTCCVCWGCTLTSLCSSRSFCVLRMLPDLAIQVFLRIVSAVGSFEVISPSDTKKACLLPAKSSDFLKLHGFLGDCPIAHCPCRCLLSVSCHIHCPWPKTCAFGTHLSNSRRPADNGVMGFGCECWYVVGGNFPIQDCCTPSQAGLTEAYKKSQTETVAWVKGIMTGRALGADLLFLTFSWSTHVS